MGRIKPVPRSVKTMKAGRVTYGEVVDEVRVSERYSDEDFEDCVQLIRWQDGGESIRFCYYVRDHESGDDAWTFANRPLSIGVDKLRELLAKASEKNWFKGALPY